MRTEAELIKEGLQWIVNPDKWAEFIMGLETEELIIVGRLDSHKLGAEWFNSLPTRKVGPGDAPYMVNPSTTTFTFEVVEKLDDGNVLVKIK